MTQMESPKRKMQKKNDYQRHKLFRKIKRRRKAQAESEQQIAEKQLRRKLKLPKFGNGKTREVYTSDIHFNNDDAAGGVDRYGNKFDYIQLPENIVTARKIPTFKDIEKQIGRKITQDEIDKVIAVDPQIPIEVDQHIENGMYSPSITNELTNTIVGTAGDAVNYLANKAGLPNLAPNEQLVETRDGDALFDLPGYGQVAKLSLYGLGRYGGKLGLKKLQKLARQKLLERGFDKSSVDINKLKQEYQLEKPRQQKYKPKAQLELPNEDAGLYEDVIDTQLPNELSPSYISRKNSQVVNEDGSINVRNLVRARRQLRKAYPDAKNPKKIFNTDFLTGIPTNLNQHIGSVVKTAQDIPVPLGYTRQDLVQAALGHDIGKVIDARQGQHEQISADMLANAMKQNGIIGVQDIKPDVIQSIAKHGLGDQSMDLDPLTKALHVADVTRGANYDQAAIHAGYLFNYPREYPKWNFQKKPLHDELVQNINPVLKRYGYETINPNSTLQEAQETLNSTIDSHRSFVRGVYDKKYSPAQTYMLTNEPELDKLGHSGRRGIEKHRGLYGIPHQNYDGLYLSTNANFLDEYGNGGVGGKVGLVRIPQNEVSKNSKSLSERLLAGDFDVYNSKQIHHGMAGNPQSSWTLFGEPYRLQTGRSLRQDMIEKDPNVPKVEGRYAHNKGQVLSQMKPGDINIGTYYLDGYTYDQQPTFGQIVDKLNKSLEKEGLPKIKSFARTDKNGEVEDLVYNNAEGIMILHDNIAMLDELQKLADVVKPYIKDEKKLRKQRYEILNNPDYLWSNELSEQMEDIQHKLSQIDKFRYNFTNINLNMDRVTPKQKRSAMFAGNVDRIRRAVLQSSLDDYFEGVKKQKARVKYNAKDREKYLSNPENQAAFMRSQGVLPRYDHPTYNHVLTITPGEHMEDMPNKMATKNMQLGPSQIAVIGKRGDQVVDLVKELSPEEIYDIKQQTKNYTNLKKPSEKKKYKDTGNRIYGLKLSRKTKQ